MPTASARLRRKLDIVLPGFDVPGRLLLEHPQARELYPRYLTINWYLALAAVPLMESALGRARSLAPEDPAAAALADYLERHIPEEMHGAEPGSDVLDDLEALGVEPAALRTRPVPAKIAAVIGNQFFWIWQAHPVAIVGFLEIEALHPNPVTVERLIEKTGLPREGFRQLLLHAELDVEHARELHRVLDSLPLEPHHEQLIGVSALQTIALLIDAALDIVATGPALPPTPASASSRRSAAAAAGTSASSL